MSPQGIRSLSERRMALERAFFIETDRKLIEELQIMRNMDESRQNLATASGITNEIVLTRLVELDIHAETVASLAMVPLVAVAWADGHMDPKERDAIMHASENAGFARDGIDYVLLDRWLSHKPGPELVDAWGEYVQGLCELLQPAERAALRKDIMDHAQAVAEAAGGFLGLLARVSVEEEHVMEKLCMAFITPADR